jgi:hypothetical protein
VVPATAVVKQPRAVGESDGEHAHTLAALGVSAAQWKAAELRLAIAHAVAGGK